MSSHSLAIFACNKCGHSSHFIRYHGASHSMEGQPNSAMSCKGDHSKMSFTCGPHIHVTCTHCGYEWYTLPLDEGIG